MCIYVYIYNYIYTADYDIWLYMSIYWNFGIGCWNKCIEIHQPKTNEEMETYENDGSFYPLGTDTYLCGHVHGGFPGPVAPHGLAGYKAIAIWGSIITIKWYISVPGLVGIIFGVLDIPLGFYDLVSLEFGSRCGLKIVDHLSKETSWKIARLPR